MKKGMLLSIVASTVLFAGGDIAPVQPVAEAPAASCNDFYGQVGAAVIAEYYAVGDENLTLVHYGAAAVLGVNKEIFSGVTFNAEVQGMAHQAYAKLGDADGVRGAMTERGGLTQLNLGYTFGNTAIKVGRFSLDKNLSPLIYTDTNYLGMKDVTVEGVIVANTDLADTVLWATYAQNAVSFGATTTRDRAGIVAAGFQNKSFADTTITGAAYYDLNGTGNHTWTALGALSVDTKLSDFDLSLGGAAAKWDADGAENSFVVGASLGTSFSSVDLTLAATYSNDGMAYSKYTGITNPVGEKGFGVGAKVSTEVSGYKIWAAASFSKGSDTDNKKTQASIGASTTISGVNFAADYRFQKFNDDTAHRVRAKAVYKF